jgi:Mg-chelatase subunit ChlD
MEEERLIKWRLLLGEAASQDQEVPLEGRLQKIDEVLEALYEQDREGGMAPTSPAVRKWLKDVRNYFPKPVVRLLQQDAMDRLGLKEMLLEPELLETLTPDVQLVSTLMELKSLIPDPARDTVRELIRQLVSELEEQLKHPLLDALQGSLNRSAPNPRPKLKEIDWHRTIRANLKHYQPEYQSIIIERLKGWSRKSRSLHHLYLVIDQSASMSSSLVYAGILGSIMASVRSLKTHFIVFDTSVADLTEELDDPVELLFGLQLGGGTHISKALGYVGQKIEHGKDTTVVLISDLFEGGRPQEVLQQARALQQKGADLITLLALDDEGAPAFHKELAGQLANLNIPVFACTPRQFPGLMAAALNQQDLHQWMFQEGIHPKS